MHLVRTSIVERMMLFWNRRSPATQEFLCCCIAILITFVICITTTYFHKPTSQFVAPCNQWNQVISSPYGIRENPFEKENAEIHAGIDLAIAEGTPIFAVDSGKVVSAECSDTGYGFHLIISHANDFSSLYAHCSKLLVQSGQHVEKGQTIALSGTTGKSTGPHLHFELRKGNQTVDPSLFLPDS